LSKIHSYRLLFRQWEMDVRQGEENVERPAVNKNNTNVTK